MKVRTVSYQKVFPIAQFVNQKIGVEIEIDERDYEVGKDPEEEAIRLAKEMVNRWGTEQSLLQVDRNEPVPVVHIPKEEPELSPAAAVAEMIQSCTDVKSLRFYEGMIKKQENKDQFELWKLYDNKKTELTIYKL
jgi:hypothetical protein